MAQLKDILFYLLFYPISLIYGGIVAFRNLLFDWGLLKSKSFHTPIICVGNITVGGTGKTPMVSYLTKRLEDQYKVAILSRGYKRKSKGFVLSEKDSSSTQIGDEPRLLSLRHPKAIVAVDGNRVNGIGQLLNHTTKPEVIILDDAFQHRYVKPGLNILLVDYNRPPFKDHLLPLGRLREKWKNHRRAGIIIVNKTPEDITPIEKSLFEKKIRLLPFQQLFFTHIRYASLLNKINANESTPLTHVKKEQQSIVLVSGIANPNPLEQFIQEQTKKKVIHYIFPDHHTYSSKEIDQICSCFEKIKDSNKIIITTEKDAVKLSEMELPKIMQQHLFYLPIDTHFMDNKANNFDTLVTRYIETGKKVSGLNR